MNTTIRNKLFTSSKVKSSLADSLTAGLKEALAKAFAVAPGEKIRIIDDPPKTHRLKDIHPSNPVWKGYRAQQAHLRGLEAEEERERQRKFDA